MNTLIDLNTVLEKFEENMREKISNDYEHLVKNINASFTSILNTTVTNAETIESDMKSWIQEIKNYFEDGTKAKKIIQSNNSTFQ